MKIKSFIAPTIREALTSVKREMGDSPLILDTRDIEEGDIKATAGTKLVEIVAAANFIEQDINKELKGDDRLNVFSKVDRGVENDLPEAIKELSDKLSAQQVEEEYAQILTRETLCDLGKVPTASLRSTSEQAVGKEGFEKMDLQQQIIKERFISKIKIPASNLANEGTHKAMAFVGGTGVGKTTTISKLALDARTHSDKDILLIKIKDDSEERLNKLAELIGATVWVVTTRQELSMIIDEFKSTSLIFIDTPGINHLNNVELLELKEYIHNMPNLEIHLVISATTRFVDVINTVKNYSIIPVQRLLFTKVDETDIYGTLFSVAMATKIPLSYITDGQEIQRNIKPVTGSMIAEMVIG
jgi:flagellar biosynthesis protein FlhF